MELRSRRGCERSMQFLKIVALATAGAVLYGIVHDQVTIRISPAYFTVFHPHLFTTNSLTLLALAWGVLATWWAGVIMGCLLGVAARAGTEPRITSSQVVRPVLALLAVMGVSALFFGVLGFRLASRHAVTALAGAPADTSHEYARLIGVWWAHSASYAVGFLGALVLCVVTLIRRLRDRMQVAKSAEGSKA